MDGNGKRVSGSPEVTGEERRSPCARRRLRNGEPETQLPYRDPERLGALLEKLQPRLTAVALRFTRDPDSARDIVQNAFEKVVRHGAKFQGHSRVSTWIHRIVANEALMWLRSERRRFGLYGEVSDTVGAGVADSAPDPAEQMDDRQSKARLWDGIERLSREERDVVLHCALAGLSYAEYGARTGAHPAALKSRAHRARRRLGAWLGDPTSEARPA